MSEKPTREFLELLTKRLADEGKLIEAGWVGLRIAAIPLDAPEIQIQEMRNAFMAGAQHLFSSIISIMEADAEPTENDLRRMCLIDDELKLFAKEVHSRVNKPGHA